MQKVHTTTQILHSTMADAPTYRESHPDNPALVVSAWTNETGPSLTYSAYVRLKSGKTYWKQRAFFESEALQIIELTLLCLKQLNPDLPLSPHLLNYLAECEQLRKNKPTP